MPPICVIFCCSSSRHTTGCGVSLSNSVRVGVRPGRATLRANSIVAHCRPRQMPKNGTPVLAGEADRLDLAGDAALVEPAGHQQAVHAGQALGRPVPLDLLRLDCGPLAPWRGGRCRRGRAPRTRDLYASRCLTYLPTTAMVTSWAGFRIRSSICRQSSISSGPAWVRCELLDDQLVELVVDEAQRHLVDAELLVLLLDHRPPLDVAEQGDLLAVVLRDLPLGPADQHVRLDADLAQLHDAVLRRLGLQLAGRLQVRHERQVDEQAVVLADVEGELADGLEERHRPRCRRRCRRSR